MRSPTNLALLACVLLIPLLTSCFTSMVWNTDLDSTSLTDDATYAQEDDDSSIWTRLALTPFALILDIITWPLQELVADENDDDEDEDDGYAPPPYDPYDPDDGPKSRPNTARAQRG